MISGDFAVVVENLLIEDFQVLTSHEKSDPHQRHQPGLSKGAGGICDPEVVEI